MQRTILSIALLVTAAILVPARASDSDAAFAKSVVNIEALCLKGNDLCRCIEFTFSNDGSVDEHQIAFLPLSNGAAARFWNQHANERYERHQHDAHVPVRVAVYDAQAHQWTPVAADAQCPLCVPGSLAQDKLKRKRWVRFESDATSSWRPRDSWWSFQSIFARGEHKRLFVVVKSPHGPVVYASVGDSGFHYHYSTSQNGRFYVLLDSGWVLSPRPDYVVISPVRSWADVARAYMHAQTGVLTGADQLPQFTGSVEQIVDKAVGYITSRKLGYDGKLDVGGYPKQNVAAILAAGKTDCKGLTTLLYALLRKSGVKADPILLNAFGMTPLSFGVPGNWANHVMLYIPAIDRYVDLTMSLPSHGKYTWRTSGDWFTGDVVLNLATGHFAVVPEQTGRHKKIDSTATAHDNARAGGRAASSGNILHQP